jgi:DNA-directed RNA polymerase specialized sigma24 family protein
MNEVDPEEISILLIGDSQEQECAISLIHKHLQKSIIYKIRVTAISLAPDELLDVYQEVLLNVWNAAKEKRYDPDKPLLPFLFMLAQRRAYDRLRKNEAKKIHESSLLDEVTESLKDTKVGEAWQIVATRNDGHRMMGIIRKTVVKMPTRQRQVASVVIENFPEVLSPQDVSEVIYRTTGEKITVVAAKRAWQEARNKIREQLIDAGYMEDNADGRYRSEI